MACPSGSERGAGDGINSCSCTGNRVTAAADPTTSSPMVNCDSKLLYILQCILIRKVYLSCIHVYSMCILHLFLPSLFIACDVGYSRVSIKDPSGLCSCKYNVHVCMYIVVAVHGQDSMRLACVNAVLAVHCNYIVGSS